MSKSECSIYYMLFTNQIKPYNNWFISRRLLDSHVCSFLKNTNILVLEIKQRRTKGMMPYQNTKS